MSPRPGPVRQYVGARMSVEQIQSLKDAAERDGVDVSEVIRRLIDRYLMSRSWDDVSDDELTFTSADLDRIRYPECWPCADGDGGEEIGFAPGRTEPDITGCEGTCGASRAAAGFGAPGS